MPSLDPRGRAIARAINGRPATYAIKRHDRLYLDVRGEGRAAWRIRYRPKPNANQRWFTLSEDARNADFKKIARKASELLTALQLDGIDPHAEGEKAAKPQRTVADCYKLWLDHTGKRRGKPLCRKTRAGYDSVFKLHIQPHFGKYALTDLDRATIERVLAKVKAATTNAEKGYRGLQATKVLKVLSSICEWCIDREWIDRNPCRGIDLPVPIAHPNGKQSRPPTNPELRQLWNDGPHVMSPAQTRVIRIAILIGRRISEIAGAEREDAKLDATIPCLFIPAQREGNKPKMDDAVPLPPLALSIIKEALAASQPDEPLFIGAATRWTASKVLTTTRRAWKWPDPPVRFHDFRGLINDQMAALGVPTELRSRTLHHTGDLQQLVNTVYSAYDFLPDRLRALQLWEDRLLEIVTNRPPAGLRW
ncbi:tyrosine-type recombinase/integrase [Hyphomicrobium sp.]|uniref:tyrosine-type recombinase/integrase n=1 Tax=Hyphomicrobium sp. TaxID=82 RepID=UPI002FE248D4